MDNRQGKSKLAAMAKAMTEAMGKEVAARFPVHVITKEEMQGKIKGLPLDFIVMDETTPTRWNPSAEMFKKREAITITPAEWEELQVGRSAVLFLQSEGYRPSTNPVHARAFWEGGSANEMLKQIASAVRHVKDERGNLLDCVQGLVQFRQDVAKGVVSDSGVSVVGNVSIPRVVVDFPVGDFEAQQAFIGAMRP